MTVAGYAPLPSHSFRDSRLFTAPVVPAHDRRLPHLRLPRPKTLLAGGVAAVLLCLVLLTPSRRRSQHDQQILLLGEDPDATFDDLYLASHAGWHDYEPASRPALSDDGLTSWAERLSPRCAEMWVAEGRLCEELEGAFDGDKAPQIGLLYTWTNGSDVLLRRWKAEITSGLSGRIRPGREAVREKLTSNHFREHDELRYSIRSALRAFKPSALSSLRLVTTDLPANSLYSDLLAPVEAPLNYTPLVESSRIGQQPTWLSSDTAHRTPPLEVVHHTDLFDRSVALPTFNSLSIESQFPQLQPTSEFALYLNDDTFLFGDGNLTAADVGVPLLGPAFRIQADLTADGRAPGELAGPPDGEWASLKRANWLLDRRFGRRHRGYLAHIPKALSMPLLQELDAVWHDELLTTATSRFRGRKTEFQLAFLATHFIIEAHREALLHSFFVARSDRDLDGVLSLDERHSMLAELGFDLDFSDLDNSEARVLHVPFPKRQTRAHLPQLLRQAGLTAPGATGIAFSSMDGFGMGVVRGDKPKELWRPVIHFDETGAPADELEANKTAAGRAACSIDLDKCFGSEFLSPASSSRVSALDIFRRVASEKPHCGDCAIAALVGKSGRTGLSAFLPDCGSSTASETGEPLPPTALFALAKTSTLAHLPLSLHSSSSSSSSPTCASARTLSIRRILRYSYYLGDSSSRFISLRQAKLTQVVLEKMREGQKKGVRMPTFLTLNDDFISDLVSTQADKHLRNFFQTQWPDPSPYEVVAGE
ncbi:hypothetical protein JCM10207_000733 [Rhodosporidiobolus poonsookiae]